MPANCILCRGVVAWHAYHKTSYDLYYFFDHMPGLVASGWGQGHLNYNVTLTASGTWCPPRLYHVQVAGEATLRMNESAVVHSGAACASCGVTSGNYHHRACTVELCPVHSGLGQTFALCGCTINRTSVVTPLFTQKSRMTGPLHVTIPFQYGAAPQEFVTSPP